MLRISQQLSRNIPKYFHYNRASFSSVGKGFDLLGPDCLQAEDGNMKTTVLAFGDTLFQVNHSLVGQSVLLLPNKYFLWKPKTIDDITIDSLSVLTTIFPTVEILFIGCGENNAKPLPKEFYDHFRKYGIVVEQSTTSNAASTFNVLNSEGRNVAAALLTMEPYPNRVTDFHLS